MSLTAGDALGGPDVVPVDLERLFEAQLPRFSARRASVAVNARGRPPPRSWPR